MSLYKGRRIALLLLMLVAAASAQQQYIAFFSAETETYRRIVLDGVSNRRVEVRQDSLGGVTILIWGARQEDYVGRRRYEQGYLVPATMQIDFPRRNLMTISVTGNRFADVVRYELVEPALSLICSRNPCHRNRYSMSNPLPPSGPMAALCPTPGQARSNPNRGQSPLMASSGSALCARWCGNLSLIWGC